MSDGTKPPEDDVVDEEMVNDSMGTIDVSDATGLGPGDEDENDEPRED